MYEAPEQFGGQHARADTRKLTFEADALSFDTVRPATIATATGGIAALSGLVYVLAAQPVEVPLPPKPSTSSAVAPVPTVSGTPPPAAATPDAGASKEQLAHARIAAAINDETAAPLKGKAGRAAPAPSNSSVAIAACEEELLALRELPRDTEGYRVASAGLKRLYVRLQDIATSAAGEWKLAAVVLMGECMTELSDRSDALTPTLCANERVDHSDCAELMEQMGQNTSRARAAEHYRAAVQQAVEERLDTPYVELAKGRLTP